MIDIPEQTQSTNMETSEPDSSGSLFYRTITHSGKAGIKIKGSRFIAHAEPAFDEEQCKHLIGRYQKCYHDASHVCFAYRTGVGDRSAYRFSDAGEPAGSAGAPIFKVIEGTGLTNVIILVIRYFGGTKLGIGGLVRAYTDATRTVLASIETVKKIITKPLHFQIEYDVFKPVLRELSAKHAEITEQNYADKIVFHVSVPINSWMLLKNNLTNMTSGKVEFLPLHEGKTGR